MLGEEADLPSFVPVEYIVVCLFCFSHSSRQAPHVLVHCLPPLTLQKPGRDTAQFCHCFSKQTDANKQESTVCGDSPLGHPDCFSCMLPSSWLPQGAWLCRRKEKRIAVHKPFCNLSNCFWVPESCLLGTPEKIATRAPEANKVIWDRIWMKWGNQGRDSEMG